MIGGNPEFFEITKRIHNRLHGADGDGGELGDEAREIYERTLAASTEELVARVRPGDIVFLHDPQTAGMAAALRERGTIVVWRCHVGLDVPNDVARSAWDFLRPYVEPADAFVFSRRSFVWDGIDEDRTWLVAPSIDAFSPKNQELPDTAVRAILRTIGLGDGEEPTAAGRFTRVDGTPGRVDRAAELHQDGLIPTDATLITQVSRWDSLKDPIGVLRGFTSALADRPEAHLLLAGPSVAAVADDPEGAGVLADVIAERERLPAEERARVHLACLPMDDIQENAAMVNAIQRRSDIVVQKSFAEGFGLTVAEAMWKSRPVVASARGGIQDQITDRESGLLVQDPTDLQRGVRRDPRRAGRRSRDARAHRRRRPRPGPRRVPRLAPPAPVRAAARGPAGRPERAGSLTRLRRSPAPGAPPEGDQSWTAGRPIAEPDGHGVDTKIAACRNCVLL